jgi:hypothetical protein
MDANAHVAAAITHLRSAIKLIRAEDEERIRAEHASPFHDGGNEDYFDPMAGYLEGVIEKIEEKLLNEWGQSR